MLCDVLKFSLSSCLECIVDTRLCHLLFHRGSKVKAGRNCLLPYVQKLVAMQCNELGFRKLWGYYAKSLKRTQTQSARLLYMR